MRTLAFPLTLVILTLSSSAQTKEILEVIDGREAVVRALPSNRSDRIAEPLLPGIRVEKLGESGWFHQLRLADGRLGWSLKKNFRTVKEAPTARIPVARTEPAPVNGPFTPDQVKDLLAGRNITRIIVLDITVTVTAGKTPPASDDRGLTTDDIILVETETDPSTARIPASADGAAVTPGESPSQTVITRFRPDGDGPVPRMVPGTRVIYDREYNAVLFYAPIIETEQEDPAPKDKGSPETESEGIIALGE